MKMQWVIRSSFPVHDTGSKDVGLDQEESNLFSKKGDEARNN